MVIEQLFFELIQVAIGKLICLSRTPSEEEWKELYEIDKKQSLVGVCFAGVQRLQGQHPSMILRHTQEPLRMWKRTSLQPICIVLGTTRDCRAG